MLRKKEDIGVMEYFSNLYVLAKSYFYNVKTIRFWNMRKTSQIGLKSTCHSLLFALIDSIVAWNLRRFRPRLNLDTNEGLPIFADEIELVSTAGPIARKNFVALFFF